MLGRLNEEMSCANSRFFRTVLYPDPTISKAMRDQFVLHWQTVVEVPKVTIDFGNGRKLERTLTGNSMHMVLTSDGLPIDAMPGLVTPLVFNQWLSEVNVLDQRLAKLPANKRQAEIVTFHKQRDPQRFQAERKLNLGNVAELSPLDPKWKKIADEYWASALQTSPRLGTFSPESTVLLTRLVPAEAAMPLAVSKSIAETPMLRMVRKLENSIYRDTAYNLLALQPKIDRIFVQTGAVNEQQLTRIVYNGVFLMPLSDRWLGLSPGDEFVAIENGGRTEGSDFAAVFNVER